MIASFLYAFFIYPLEAYIETVYNISINIIPNCGIAILSVSLAVQVLTLPIYIHTDALQDIDRLKRDNMSKWINHIRSTFKGDERVMMLNEYYRIEHYHPIYSMRSSLPIVLQIPFFIAAYNYLSNLWELSLNSFFVFENLATPDGLLKIGAVDINVLPIVMTVINVLSGFIYTKGLSTKEKAQLYLTALLFLVLLYNSPSGLVLYWTFNNTFSLFKNIFVKYVRKPRRVINYGVFLFGVFFVIYCFYKGKLVSPTYRLVTIIVALCCCIPLLDSFFSSRIDSVSIGIDEAINTKLFLACSVSLALILGLWIPSNIVAESPSEFTIQGHYVDPNYYVIYAFLVAAGIFLLWGPVVYKFIELRHKMVASYFICIMTCVSLLDYFFFSSNLGNMNARMIYDNHVGYSFSEKIINLIFIFLCAILAVLAINRYKKKVFNVCVILNVALALAGVSNIIKTESVLAKTPYIKNDNYFIDNHPQLVFSKSHKNVMVIMLDRAIGGYFPYIIKEKPEILSMFSGFTYYPNAVSTGGGTATGSPALFGGYEYSFYEIEKRVKEENLVDIHDEALRVLPTVFSSNGYDCSVVDVPYPGYGSKSVKQLYEDIDHVEGFNMSGYAKTSEQAEFENAYFKEVCQHNMIRHSAFIVAPLVFRHGIYHEGSYLDRKKPINYNPYYWTLQQYKEISESSDTKRGSFVMLCNDTTHYPIELQLPDYIEKFDNDNSAYWDEWEENFNVNGETLVHMDSFSQRNHYMVQVAALLELGKWFGRLKEMGVYDNTRIVITSDHGYPLGQFDELIHEDGFDAECVYPLFLFKDFDSKDYTVDHDFVSNADASLMAMNGLVNDYTNPYTGKDMLDNQEKVKHDGIIVTNIGRTIDDKTIDKRWYIVKNEIFDESNWIRIDN